MFGTSSNTSSSSRLIQDHITSNNNDSSKASPQRVAYDLSPPLKQRLAPTIHSNYKGDSPVRVLAADSTVKTYSAENKRTRKNKKFFDKLAVKYGLPPKQFLSEEEYQKQKAASQTIAEVPQPVETLTRAQPLREQKQLESTSEVTSAATVEETASPQKPEDTRPSSRETQLRRHMRRVERKFFGVSTEEHQNAQAEISRASQVEGGVSYAVTPQKQDKHPLSRNAQLQSVLASAKHHQQLVRSESNKTSELKSRILASFEKTSLARNTLSEKNDSSVHTNSHAVNLNSSGSVVSGDVSSVSTAFSGKHSTSRN
eukprot:gene39515-48828_t